MKEEGRRTFQYQGGRREFWQGGPSGVCMGSRMSESLFQVPTGTKKRGWKEQGPKEEGNGKGEDLQTYTQEKRVKYTKS